MNPSQDILLAIAFSYSGDSFCFPENSTSGGKGNGFFRLERKRPNILRINAEDIGNNLQKTPTARSAFLAGGEVDHSTLGIYSYYLARLVFNIDNCPHGGEDAVYAPGAADDISNLEVGEKDVVCAATCGYGTSYILLRQVSLCQKFPSQLLCCCSIISPGRKHVVSQKVAALSYGPLTSC